MAQQTAMQKLINEIKEAVPYLKLSIYQENFDKSLEREKQQIIDAHAHHRCVNDKTMDCTLEAYEKAEQYYNETYGEKSI